jgi:NAD(P)-dependent dehydrogenase (short-subunit alcohol dehydrogenase family)
VEAIRMSDPLFDVGGKSVVVTGGTSGIGRMIAQGFVSRGARVYIASRKEDACRQTAAELSSSGECRAVVADLATSEGIETLVGEVSSHEAALHVLVNNAGATWGAPLEDYPDSAFDRVLRLNVWAPFRAAVSLLPLLRAAARENDPGRIINVSSIEGTAVPEHENYAYPASKSALNMLTRHLARRLARDSITVNAIAPGPFPTRMIAFMERDPEMWAEISRKIPLRRMGADDDVVGSALFLASRAGAYVTGAVLPVDGGLAGAGRM